MGSPIPGRAPVPLASRPLIPGAAAACLPDSCSPAQRYMCCNPAVDSYARFLQFSGPAPLTPKDKLLLAGRGVIDPFNLLTIGGEAAVSIASNSHTAYGPGFPGFGKYAGVSLTEDISAEFFGAFLIPSLAHQDPRYRRTPNLPMRQRIIHVIDAGFIGQDDNGLPMFNYANVFGTIATSALGNAYIPGRQTSWGASAARISVALATNPIGNALAEFLPDVARRVNVNVVLVQRVINRVAIAEGGVGSQ